MPDGETRTARAETRFGQGFLTDIWYFAALAADLKPGRLVHRDILGEPVVLGRAPSGALFALRDICPHRAAPLSAGRSGATSRGGERGVPLPRLAVPRRRRLRGDPLAGRPTRPWTCQSDPGAPLSGRREPGDGLRLDGVGRARPASRTSRRRCSRAWSAARPSWSTAMDFDAHIDHAVVGLMDPAHGPYVHQQWWWRSSEQSSTTRPRRSSRARRASPCCATRRRRTAAPTPSWAASPETEITFRLPGLRWEHVTVGAAPGAVADLPDADRRRPKTRDHPDRLVRPPGVQRCSSRSSARWARAVPAPGRRAW